MRYIDFILKSRTLNESRRHPGETGAGLGATSGGGQILKDADDLMQAIHTTGATVTTP
jgi:hypothetical protein